MWISTAHGRVYVGECTRQADFRNVIWLKLNISTCSSDRKVAIGSWPRRLNAMQYIFVYTSLISARPFRASSHIPPLTSISSHYFILSFLRRSKKCLDWCYSSGGGAFTAPDHKRSLLSFARIGSFSESVTVRQRVGRV